MDWILHHIQFLIAAAAGVAWWLNQRRQAAQTDKPETPKREVFQDPQLAERTRRIREEIQRKIEERARAYTQPSVPAPQRDPVTPPVIREPVVRRAEPPAIPRANPANAQRTAEILEQQAALAERLREAKLMQASAARRIQSDNQASAGTPLPSAIAIGLAEDLRDPKALRRAFLLREVLGPPVSLRP